MLFVEENIFPKCKLEIRSDCQNVFLQVVTLICCDRHFKRLHSYISIAMTPEFMLLAQHFHDTRVSIPLKYILISAPAQIYIL